MAGGIATLLDSVPRRSAASHGMQITAETLDPKMEFADYQAIDDLQIAGRRTIAERISLYRAEDFDGATVLDLGCNVGQMMYQALKWNAREVVGVEVNAGLARKARRVLKCRVVIGDLDRRMTWNALPRCDVVLLLSLVHWVGDPVRLVKRASEKTTKVLYFEGHPKHLVRDDYGQKLFRHTNFSRIERLGETPEARPFFRLSFA
jgi:SAM-dependent methyltransferase